MQIYIVDNRNEDLVTYTRVACLNVQHMRL